MIEKLNNIFNRENIQLKLIELLFTLIFLIFFKRNVKLLLKKETYDKISELFYFGIRNYKAVINRNFELYNFSYSKIEYFTDVLNNISLYERKMIKVALEFQFENLPFELSCYDIYPDKEFDGYDIDCYVKKNGLFKNKYYKIVGRYGRVIKLENDKEIDMFPYKWIFYKPMTLLKRRMDIIKNL